MSDLSKEFKQVIKDINLTNKEVAETMDMKYNSIRSCFYQRDPAWAKLAVKIHRMTKEKYDK